MYMTLTSHSTVMFTLVFELAMVTEDLRFTGGGGAKRKIFTI